MGILCFGGSFNPIHVGHLICARQVAEELGFDKIMLIPNATPPHKLNDRDIAPAEDRLEMCRLAVEGDRLFEVSDIEVRRGGASYTIDTVRALRHQGHDVVHWLIGSDMFNYLPKWHLVDDLVRETRFVIMERPGQEIQWREIPTLFKEFHGQGAIVPQIDISATMIRQRLLLGRPISYLVSASVEQYIRTHKLYVYSK